MAEDTPNTPKKTTSEQPTPKKIELTEDQFNALMQRLNQVENQKQPVQQLEQPTLTATGFAGTIEKYPTDSKRYPDPTEELLATKHPLLTRHNLPDNYVLKYEVKALRYQTAQGLWIREPRFTLTLYRKIYDTETGEWGGKLSKIQTGHWTEDEIVAEEFARALGIKLDNITKQELLDRMRIERFRSWLIELFRPQKEARTKKSVTEEVIGGLVTEVTDIQQVKGGRGL